MSSKRVKTRSSQQEALDYLIKCSDAYYHSAEPLVSDAEFDRLVEQYESTYGVPFTYIGSAAKVGNTQTKATLPVPMMSLNKCKDLVAVQRFVINATTYAATFTKNKFTDQYVFSEKLDGVSLLYVASPSTPIRLYTRGDGRIGTDVSYLVDYLRLPALPTNLTATVIIRGELIIPKEYKDKLGVNLRNIVCGFVNAKTVDVHLAPCVRFVAYWVHALSPSEGFEWLKQYGFDIPQVVRSKTCTFAECNEVLTQFEAKSRYGIDGLVVARNVLVSSNAEGYENPKHVMAFKRMGVTKETRVVNVLWQTSRYRTLHPRVRIKPIDIDGCTIVFVSGVHAQYVQQNGIGPGALVEVQRSGDVIPNIVRVIEPAAKAQLPSVDCEWHGVHLRLLHSTSETNEAQVERVVYSLKLLKMKGMSEQTLKKLFVAGHTTELRLWNLGVEDILQLDGFQQRLASNVVQMLQQTKSTLLHLSRAEGLVWLLQASACFPVFGETKLTKIVKDSGIDVWALLQTTPSVEQIADVERKLASVSIKTQAVLFLEGCKAFQASTVAKELMAFYLSNSVAPSQDSSSTITTSTPITMHVVCTGFRDAALVAEALQRGIKITDGTVSKKTSVLIVADLSSTSSKVNTAQTLGIPIVTVAQFRQQWLL
jgi:DNA ligase (NAD+)